MWWSRKAGIKMEIRDGKLSGRKVEAEFLDSGPRMPRQAIINKMIFIFSHI